MKKEIYIRVDGDAETGWGHFFRCLALAEFLESHFEITFVCQKNNPDLIRRISEKCNFLKIEKETDFFNSIKEKSLVVVDGYKFNSSFFQKLKTLNVKVICIQDIEHFSHNLDLVINHLPNVGKYYKNVNVLAGPRYAIIRKKILKWPNTSKKTEEGYLISLGGTKNYDLINHVVNLIKQIDKKTTIRILTTQKNCEKINPEGVDIYFNQDEEAIIKLIDKSAFCLITSGMISYEVLARNKRAVVGALNEGQAKIAEEFKQMGLVESVGFWEDINLEKLKRALSLNAIKPEEIKKIFDGKSGDRLIEKFLQL